jgi:hypothetical protein
MQAKSRMQATEVVPGSRRPGFKRVAVAAGALIVVFLLGYIPSSVNSHNARQQNAELQDKLTTAELGSELAMAGYEAGRNNYANAAQFSSNFFNGLRQTITHTQDAALKQKLQAILARRDEITAGLAAVDQTVKEKLAQMYAEYFHCFPSK